MKVEFDHEKYGQGDHTVSTGYATIIIVDGKAEIDGDDEAQIILAKSIGGRKYKPPTRMIRASGVRGTTNVEEPQKKKRGKQK